MVELTGFEPATSSSRTKRATSLRYSSLMRQNDYTLPHRIVQGKEQNSLIFFLLYSIGRSFDERSYNDAPLNGFGKAMRGR